MTEQVLIATGLASNNVSILDIVLNDADAINNEDALAHVVCENDEEPLPHGAKSRWFAMEREEFKNAQRERSRTDRQEPFYQDM